MCMELIYKVYVIFDNIGGLKVCFLVCIGGVVVGWVEDILFDLKIYLLCVMFDIEECYNYIFDISLLSICIFGLLGE